jgi:hypothetical protein
VRVSLVAWGAEVNAIFEWTYTRVDTRRLSLTPHHVTKNDEEPTLFTSMGSETDLIGLSPLVYPHMYSTDVNAFIKAGFPRASAL